jgi:hypothetical protein
VELPRARLHRERPRRLAQWARLSMICAATPRRFSHSASVRPFGPAPVINTSVSKLVMFATSVRAVSSVAASRVLFAAGGGEESRAVSENFLMSWEARVAFQRPSSVCPRNQPTCRQRRTGVRLDSLKSNRKNEL